MRAIITATLKTNDAGFDPDFYPRQPRDYIISSRLFSKKITIARVRGRDNTMPGSEVVLNDFFELLIFFNISSIREEQA
jgi:hypothetical protein